MEPPQFPAQAFCHVARQYLVCRRMMKTRLVISALIVFGAIQPRAAQPIETQEAPSMASKVSELLQAARSIEEEQR